MARSSGHSASIVPPARLMARSASRRPWALPVCFSNLDVRQEAERSASPVSPAPCMRIIEPLVVGSRQALRHAIHHIAPYALGSQSSNLGSGDRRHIGRYAFFDPMMTPRHPWKTEINHLVRQHPIVVEIGCSDMLTYRDP